jgi:ATP-dependent Clp protease protease subunit
MKMKTLQIPGPIERDLYLAKQVDQASINEITKQIIEINNSDQEIIQIAKIYGFEYTPKPIKLYVDSYGGYVYQCLGLLGVMEKSQIPIHTIVTGCAMSCGFLIGIAGHERYGFSGSTYLYHSVSSASWGTTKQMEEDVIETKRLQKIIEKHTLKNTDITKEELREIYEKKIDWYIDSKLAKKLGVIDEII